MNERATACGGKISESAPALSGRASQQVSGGIAVCKRCFIEDSRSQLSPPPGRKRLQGEGEKGTVDYSLMATPLKEATLMEAEVATGVRSPCPSMEKTST